MIRRSFSAFPDGWPGHGLLLLRVSVGSLLVYWGFADLAAHNLTSFADLAAAVAGIFVISGLFTPIAGAAIVLVQALMAFSPAFANEGERSIRLFLAAVSASVAMLGPGAWSMDARRFGRKVFEIGEPRHPYSQS
jgi:putative oxidoreductase